MGGTVEPLTPWPRFRDDEERAIFAGTLQGYYEVQAIHALTNMSDRDFFKARNTPGRVEGWPIARRKFPAIWQAEYDRRFLLRPAAFVPMDDGLLLRAAEAIE